MSFFHHGTIRNYTASLLNLFNDIEIQYQLSTGTTITKKIPLKYSTREKAKIFDEYTQEQLLSGNYNVLPRASISLVTMVKYEPRTKNKNSRINLYKTDASLEFLYNSVPYEFTYELVFQCRGMNEATQIIEQIAPQFNPIVNVDVFDATNLDEPTRIPVRLLDIGIETEEYDELSTNIFTVSCGISLVGNLYPPIKSQERIQEFQLMLNKIVDDVYSKQLELLSWDVGLDGYVIGDGSLDTNIDGTEYGGGSTTPTPTTPSTILSASRVSIEDTGNFFDAENVEDALQEIMTVGITEFITDIVTEPIFILGESLDSELLDDRGILFNYGGTLSPQTGFFGYDTSSNRFTFIPQAINNENVISGNSGDFQVGEIYQYQTDGIYDVNGVVVNASEIWNNTVNLVSGLKSATEYDLLIADAEGKFQITKEIPAAANIIIDCGEY